MTAGSLNCEALVIIYNHGKLFFVLQEKTGPEKVQVMPEKGAVRRRRILFSNIGSQNFGFKVSVHQKHYKKAGSQQMGKKYTIKAVKRHL